jgi:hypothetical protein
MANLNLRVNNDALTFVEVDANFTNLNNESFYGGIAFSSGTITFTPIGNDGITDAYPQVELDLSTAFPKVSSSIGGQYTPHDWVNGADLDWQKFDSNLIIDDRSKIVIKSNYFDPTLDGGSQRVFLGETGDPSGEKGLTYNISNDTGSAGQSDIRYVDGVDENSATQYIRIRDITENAEFTKAANDTMWRPHHNKFWTLISNFNTQDLIGSQISVSYDGGERVLEVTGFQSDNSVNDYVVVDEANDDYRPDELRIEVNFVSQTGDDPDTNDEGIYKIDFKEFDFIFPLSLMPAPADGTAGSVQNDYGRVMVPNGYFEADRSDISLRYADFDDIVVGGLRSQKDIRIAPFDALVSDGFATHYDNFNDRNGADVVISASNTTYSPLTGHEEKYNGGYLLLKGGATADWGGDNNKSIDSTLTDAKLSDATIDEVTNSVIQLTPMRHSVSTGQGISPGINISAGLAHIDGVNDVEGGDINIYISGGTGAGTPGNLYIRSPKTPFQSGHGHSTVTASGDDIPSTGRDKAIPLGIEYNPQYAAYQVSLPNVVIDKAATGLEHESADSQGLELLNGGGITKEPSHFNLDGISDDNPFECSSLSDSETIRRQRQVILGQRGIDPEIIRRSTVIRSDDYTWAGGVGANRHVSDDETYSPYEKLTTINTRLAFFKGSTEDFKDYYDSETVEGFRRVSGDTCILGTFYKSDDSFNSFNTIDEDGLGEIDYSEKLVAGLVIDGRVLRLVAPHGTDTDIDSGVVTEGNLNVNGQINATGDITAFSDESIKENVEVIEDAVDKVQQLNGYTFDRTDIETSRQTGVIAQEVLKVLPEAVGEKGGLHTVAYGNMVGLLIEAIKEQQGQIDSLKEELQSIKSINK